APPTPRWPTLPHPPGAPRERSSAATLVAPAAPAACPPPPLDTARTPGGEARPTPAPPSPPASSATPAPRSSTSSENHPRTDRLGRTDGKVRQTNEADRLAIRNRAAVEFRCPVMTPDVGLWPSLVQGATLGVWRTPVQIRAARPLIRRAPTAMAAVGALRFPIAPRRAHPSAGRPTGRSCPPIGVGPAAVCW